MPQYAVSFRRLDTAVQRRVLRAINGLARNPRPEGCRKLVGSDNAFRVRVGSYRVIYTVEDAIFVVAIESIRHRREAYR